MTLFEQIQLQLKKLPPEKQAEVLDFVTFLQQRRTPLPVSPAVKKANLRKAFTTLSELGTFSHIADPVEWQRQIRKDRPLPGRDA